MVRLVEGPVLKTVGGKTFAGASPVASAMKEKGQHTAVEKRNEP